MMNKGKSSFQAQEGQRQRMVVLGTVVFLLVSSMLWQTERNLVQITDNAAGDYASSGEQAQSFFAGSEPQAGSFTEEYKFKSSLTSFTPAGSDDGRTRTIDPRDQTGTPDEEAASFVQSDILSKIPAASPTFSNSDTPTGTVPELVNNTTVTSSPGSGGSGGSPGFSFIPPPPGGGLAAGPTTPPSPPPVSAIPEPDIWILMILGFFATGLGLRRNTKSSAASSARIA